MFVSVAGALSSTSMSMSMSRSLSLLRVRLPRRCLPSSWRGLSRRLATEARPVLDGTLARIAAGGDFPVNGAAMAALVARVRGAVEVTREGESHSPHCTECLA